VISPTAQVIVARFVAAMNGEVLHRASREVRAPVMAAIRQAMQSNSLQREIGLWCLREFLKHHADAIDAPSTEESGKC
jgi:hypothetical protein